MVLMECERAELEALYRRYLQRCNEHRFDELGEFVDEDVEVNGAGQGLRGYAEGLGAVVEAWPALRDRRPRAAIRACEGREGPAT
jgi:predicted ester cyclase